MTTSKWELSFMRMIFVVGLLAVGIQGDDDKDDAEVVHNRALTKDASTETRFFTPNKELNAGIGGAIIGAGGALLVSQLLKQKNNRNCNSFGRYRRDESGVESRLFGLGGGGNNNYNCPPPSYHPPQHYPQPAPHYPPPQHYPQPNHGYRPAPNHGYQPPHGYRQPTPQGYQTPSNNFNNFRKPTSSSSYTPTNSGYQQPDSSYQQPGFDHNGRPNNDFNRPSHSAQDFNRPSHGGQDFNRPSHGGQDFNRPSHGGQDFNRPSHGGQDFNRPSFNNFNSPQDNFRPGSASNAYDRPNNDPYRGQGYRGQNEYNTPVYTPTGNRHDQSGFNNDHRRPGGDRFGSDGFLNPRSALPDQKSEPHIASLEAEEDVASPTSSRVRFAD